MKEFEHSGQTIPKGKRFCTCCGEVKRESAFEGDSDHCRNCCEKMLHTRLRASGAIVWLLLAGAAVFAAVLIPKGDAVTALVERARALEAQGNLYSACDLYDEAIQCAAEGNHALFGSGQDAQEDEELVSEPVFLSPGTRIWREFVRAYARAFTRTEAAEFAAEHLNKKQIASVQPFASYALASREYDAVLAQAQSIQSQFTYSTPEDFPYDKIAEALDAFSEKRDSANVRGYAAYFKASAAWFHDPSDPQTALNLFDEMLKNVPDEYVSAYTGIAQIGMESGDPDALLRAADGILEKNKEHAEAWSWKIQAQFDAEDVQAAQKSVEAMRASCPDSPLCGAMALWLALRQGDVQGASEMLDTVAMQYDVQGDNVFQKLLSERKLEEADARFLREYVRYSMYAAAVSLLEKDYASAQLSGFEHTFNYAYYYASITNDGSLMTQSVFNIAALCASKAKDEDALDTIAQVGDCDAATRDVINGKISLKDAFCKGKAVIL